MKAFYLLGFAALALFDTAAQVSLKFASASGDLGAALLSPWIAVAIAGYLGAFVMWMTLLERAPVGPAFAASHIDVVTVLLVSVPLFDERLTMLQVTGAACIVAGILLLSRAANEAEGLAGDARHATKQEMLAESPAGDRVH